MPNPSKPFILFIQKLVRKSLKKKKLVKVEKKLKVKKSIKIESNTIK